MEKALTGLCNQEAAGAPEDTDALGCIRHDQAQDLCRARCGGMGPSSLGLLAATLPENQGAKVVNEKGGRAQRSLHDASPPTVGLAEP